MICLELYTFSKEKKKLSKRYASLEDDLRILLGAIEKLPEGNKSKHWDLLHSSANGQIKVMKVRLSCRSLKGQDRLRVIYGVRYGGVETQIDLLELYFKGEKEREDQSRINNYLSL